MLLTLFRPRTTDPAAPRLRPGRHQALGGPVDRGMTRKEAEAAAPPQGRRRAPGATR